MDTEEQVAWMIDPQAFSEETRRYERTNPENDSWRIRRTIAKKKAGVIVNFIRNGS